MLFGKYVNKYYLKYGLYFLFGILALIAVDYFQLEIPEIIGKIIDGLNEKTLNSNDLKEFVIRLLGIALIMFIGRFTWRICIFGNGIRIESDLRNKLFYSMQEQSQEFFSNNKTGSLMALYTNDLTMIRRTFGNGTIMLVDAVCLGIMTLIKMFKLNIMLAVVSLASLVVITVIGNFISKKITNATAKNFKAYGELSEYVQEDFSGISVVKAFVKEKLQIQRFQKYNQNNMDTCVTMTKISVKMRVFINGLLSVISLLILGYGAYLIYLNSIGTVNSFTIGKLIEFISYFGTLIWPIEAVGRLIELRSQGKASLDRISKILDHTVEINDDLVIDEAKDLEIKGKIEYRNLTFNYPTNNIIVLKDVSFTINPGEFVGVVGNTGIGKTTIVDLLLRIYNIPLGMLYIDDIDIMKIPLNKVRNSISYVPQDNFLFSDTIANNIAFSENNNIDIEKVKECAKLSCVYDDIMEFNNGFDTVLGERGVTVSGGQKQRIAIARAIYKNTQILILDDSLSAVDTETEKIIIQNLRKVRNDKTTIIIAHRITTLQHLDKIIVVENGCISGVGTHAELLDNNKAYKKEVELQELEKAVGESYE